MKYLLLVSAAAIVPIGAQAAQDAVLHVCVRNDTKDRSDFDAAFEFGSVRVPAGTVFNFAGHTFGGASDPMDGMHDNPAGGWVGISAAEGKRRGDLMIADANAGHDHDNAVVTLSQAMMTKNKSCANIPVAAVLSSQWNWAVSPIFGDQTMYFQAYGVIRGGVLRTDWEDEEPPLKQAGQSGSLNGVLKGTTSRTITLKPDMQ